ncbi:MAG: valine--tRNA ligase, partial [Oscillospiraceae bacterium]|nr:valine--tRNA ligase [Oscillospiraceae bacterium]
MPAQLPKTYDPKGVEPRIYQMWLDGNYFHSEVDWTKRSFSIVIPPPNVTGQLHLGHAFDNTIQDILVRVKRMQGYSAVWVPGTDHAGIATQIKVEENLRKEGKTRHDLGREAFVELVWEWKHLHGGRIIEQLKTLGSSCDWARERFTMDEGCSRAVREVFVRLYEKGLIYKGSRIINWCPHCTTALSDAEVEYRAQRGHLWHIRYRVSGSDEVLVVATTRPETMLGDTAVAVHPEDARYRHLVGGTCVLPLVDRVIPIVADSYVDPAFGTGCVKITPCHDPNDFEVAARHGLEHVLVMDGAARINENGGRYRGLTREEAREAVLRDLEAGGFLAGTEDHDHNVGACYRCGTLVEPIISSQWFVKMEPLAGPAIDVVRDGRMKFVPERFAKTYLNWMEHVRDWCISRQLWWGHRIPAFYCDDCGHVTVAREDPTACEACRSAHIRQDEDVLDTWFSSALWPFSVFGWPDETPDLKYFYPTTVVTPGYEIIFFWVARMIFSGLEHMGDVPFHTAYIHGIVRDDQGRKMSKSLGNGIDPVEIIDTYGADALRFTMVTGNAPGSDMRFYHERCEAMRNFGNKLWNAARFVLMNLHVDTWELPEELALEDKWILSKLNRLVPDVTENIESYELGVAAQKLYDFLWDDLCDWYIELVKPRLQGNDDARRSSAEQVLVSVLTGALKLLHPFMPFITEEIWQALPHEGPALVVAAWPQPDERLNFPIEEADMERVMAAIGAVRARRAEMRVPPAKKARLLVVTTHRAAFEEGRASLMKLAGCSEVEIRETPPEDMSGLVALVTDSAQLYLPLAELVRVADERARLEKERRTAEAERTKLSAKLANKGFVAKAPAAVVEAERARLDKLDSLLRKLSDSLAALP